MESTLHMTRLGGASLGILLSLTAAGCGRLGFNEPMSNGPQPNTAYEPLPAAPTHPVTSSALPPPPTTEAPAPGVATAPAGPSEPAKFPAANEKGPAIGRGEFVGAWRIASGPDNCQLFVSLTSWSGGYRASTRGCNSPELQRISAWDITGKQVALKGGDGSIIAMLASSGAEKFDGTTASKQAVSLSR